MKIKDQLSIVLTVLFCSLLSGSCANVFTDMAQRDTDNAKIFTIQQKIDRSDWTGALSDIAALSSTLQARRDIIVLKASAYAGRCGLDVLTVANNISTSAASSSLFLVLMNAFPNSTNSKVTDCISAQDTLALVGDYTVRTVDENLLMTFISFAKIGSILNRDADTDNNQSVDAAYNYCNMADATAQEVGFSIALAVKSLTAAGTSIAQAQMAVLAAACAGIGGCTITSASQIDGTMRPLVRGMTGETTSGVGIKSCANNAALCSCGT